MKQGTVVRNPHVTERVFHDRECVFHDSVSCLGVGI